MIRLKIKLTVQNASPELQVLASDSYQQTVACCANTQDGEQCLNQQASQSQFCNKHVVCLHNARPNDVYLNKFSALEYGRNGGPLLELIESRTIDTPLDYDFPSCDLTVISKQMLRRHDVVTFVSGNARHFQAALIVRDVRLKPTQLPKYNYMTPTLSR